MKFTEFLNEANKDVLTTKDVEDGDFKFDGSSRGGRDDKILFLHFKDKASRGATKRAIVKAGFPSSKIGEIDDSNIDTAYKYPYELSLFE